MLGGGGLRARAVDGREETGAVQGEGEVQVVFGVCDGGEAEAGFGGVLEVGAHVCDVEYGRHGGLRFVCFVVVYVCFKLLVVRNESFVRVSIFVLWSDVVFLVFKSCFLGFFWQLTAHCLFGPHLTFLANRPCWAAMKDSQERGGPGKMALCEGCGDFGKLRVGTGGAFLCEVVAILSIWVVVLSAWSRNRQKFGDW